MIRREFVAAILFALAVYGGLHAVGIVSSLSNAIDYREAALDDAWSAGTSH